MSLDTGLSVTAGRAILGAIRDSAVSPVRAIPQTSATGEIRLYVLPTSPTKLGAGTSLISQYPSGFHAGHGRGRTRTGRKPG